MLLKRHGWDIHALYAGPPRWGQGSRVTTVCQEPTNTKGQGRARRSSRRVSRKNVTNSDQSSNMRGAKELAARQERAVQLRMIEGWAMGTTADTRARSRC